MRRLVIAAAVGAAVIGTAVPSLALQSSTPKGTLPVGATVRTDNGVFVGTTIFGQPGLGASVANGRACVGFSLQLPVCAEVPPVTTGGVAPAGAPSQPLPGGGVVVYHDDTRTAIPRPQTPGAVLHRYPHPRLEPETCEIPHQNRRL